MRMNRITHSVTRILTITCTLGVLVSGSGSSFAQPDPNWMDHDRWRPEPSKVRTDAGKPPSDAVVLFNGSDLLQWVAMDGSPTKWKIKDGYLECTGGSGFIRTLENFGNCQLHLEFATPLPVKGEGQQRGNSGLFFGMGRYEIQILDSFQNKTYADGSAGSIYGQYPPLVNASRPPGEWQSFDVIYMAPRFDANGKLIAEAYMTVFHNGVLIQNNARLTGPTSWLERGPYSPHPEKLPIALQDHGDPVRFRNIWLRPLDRSGRREFTFGNALLDGYTGSYGASRNANVEIVREGNQLAAKFAGNRIVLFAESKTSFFAKDTDVQVDFTLGDSGKPEMLVLSVGGEVNMRLKKTK